jgi:cobalt transporter subunit CbtB
MHIEETVREASSQIALGLEQSNARNKIAAAAVAAGLGLLLVYVSGFAQLDALHNAAHDARHSAAFPCH